MGRKSRGYFADTHENGYAFPMILYALRYLIRRCTEFSSVWAMRLIHMRWYLSTVFKHEGSEFRVKKEAISKVGRTDGISGFYRVKNEARFLKASVEAHLPYCDEIVIVYNDCTDKTPEIACALERDYPNKVRVFHYKPHVYPALSREHVITSARSVHSLVNYYNYALSKTTRKIAVKIDADHIPVQPQFEQAVKKIQTEGCATMHYFYGVNIYLADDHIYVNRKKPFTHGLDCGFFPIERGIYFVHRKNSESLQLPIRMYLTRFSLGVLFYHLKGFKRVSDLPSATDLAGRRWVIEETFEPDLLAYDEAVVQYPGMLGGIQSPNISELP